MPPQLHLALYQPDIPQNCGTILRMCACFGVSASIIEPAGFPVSDRHFRRSGMDYLDHIELIRHINFAAFQTFAKSPAQPRRVVLLSTKAAVRHIDFAFRCDDILLLGRESAGVPDDVHASVDARVLIPMVPQMRSLNIAVSAAVVLGEALRQVGGYYG